MVLQRRKSGLETDIVSGKPTTPTPAGVFYVWNKEEDATLKGTNDDGTPYESGKLLDAD